ncbi:hypothetical protein KAW65_01605 [candidate division WOR-3 bacterium]|nr:hypothetical protein [candidate division WOR-3 bacterium]
MRIIKEIEIEGKKAQALFDTGSFHTYVVKRVLDERHVSWISVTPYKIGLGGKEIQVDKCCIIRGKIEGYAFHSEVTPIDDLGKVDGKILDTIIGAETMEAWEIKLDPKNGTLDLEGLKRRVFTEYFIMKNEPQRKNRLDK